MRELVKKRRMQSKTFDLGGRKRMLRTGIKKPLHFINDNGNLQDIDLTPSLDRGQYFITRAPYKARIGRNFPGYRYTSERGTISAELVEIGGKSFAKREPDYKDKRFYWRGLGFDTDLTIIPRNARMDALVTLHSENAPRSFTWEILGQRSMMRPVVGRDALGRTLEFEQQWRDDRLTIAWTGKVIDGKAARHGKPIAEPKYPVWIDPTVNEEIVAGADDAYSVSATSGTSFNSSAPGVFIGNNTAVGLLNYAGFRFQTVGVPQGATITSATLSLEVLGVSGTPQVLFYGNDVNSAPAWSTGNRMKNITKTTASAAWSPGSTGIKTIGVTGIVQEIINRTGWSSGALAIAGFDTAVGIVQIAAYEHVAAQEAQLDITYTEAGGGAAAQSVGKGLLASNLLTPRKLIY